MPVEAQLVAPSDSRCAGLGRHAWVQEHSSTDSGRGVADERESGSAPWYNFVSYRTLLGVEQLFCPLPLTNWKQEQLP